MWPILTVWREKEKKNIQTQQTIWVIHLWYVNENGHINHIV